MPNYCNTYLRVSVDPWDLAGGKPTEEHEQQARSILEDFQELVRGEYAESEKVGAFVFHQVVPRPKEFDGIVSGATTIDGEHVRQWREVDGEIVKIPPEELATMLSEYGATNWYDWQVRHWGTKWDSSEVAECHELNGDASGYPELNYRFQTAWSPPEPIIEALRARFPSATIRYFWCEEGGGMGGDEAYWILQSWTEKPGGER